MCEPRVDFREANALAGEVVWGRIGFDDAKHRLFQYWETRLTRRQSEHKLQRCIEVIAKQEATRYGGER